MVQKYKVQFHLLLLPRAEVLDDDALKEHQKCTAQLLDLGPHALMMIQRVNLMISVLRDARLTGSEVVVALQNLWMEL